jgi:hypothetical protein
MVHPLRYRVFRMLLIPAAEGILIVLSATSALASSPASGADLNCVITVTGTERYH